MFLSWVNLVLFYKLIPSHWVYVYMFSAITETFVRVIQVFIFYVIAFGLTFYVLLQNQVHISVELPRNDDFAKLSVGLLQRKHI